MINGRRVLALIPARGGSKGVPRKNIANCAGKPLIQWTIEAARASEYVDALTVSTDSLEIAAECAGVPVIRRPTELAADDTPMADVVLHALQLPHRFDICVLLQPTSPLRTADDIDGVLELLTQPRAPISKLSSDESSRIDSVVSVYESYAVPFTGEDAPRRQDRQPTLYLNGAVYAFRVEWFKEHRRFMDADTATYRMPIERSVDIDFPSDLALAALIIGTSR